MTKRALGWNSFFEEWFQRSSYKPGRITRKHNYGYEVITEENVYTARLRGRLRKDLPKSLWPSVGDWVALSFQPDYAVIEEVAPRQSKISRKVSGKTSEEQVIAANADTLFLVVSLFEDFNPRKIERYLALTTESGASPVIVLNKCDLVEDAQIYLNQIASIAPHVPVYATNALKPETLSPLLQYTGEGQTVALLGSSGAGKSTIVNELLGGIVQSVGAIGKNNKGVHTTSSRDMLFLKNGGILIDNPGIRELRVWLDKNTTLQDTFADIDEAARLCRFRDCYHESEPGCAVQAAIEAGTIDAGRLENWCKLLEERDELYIKRRQQGRGSENTIQKQVQAHIRMKKSGRKGLR